MKSKKFVKYLKKSSVMIKIRKANITLIRKSEIIVITPETVECHLRYKVSKEIPIVFHNDSTYDYFIIKQLTEEFEGEFECLEKKIITF